MMTPRTFADRRLGRRIRRIFGWSIVALFFVLTAGMIFRVEAQVQVVAGGLTQPFALLVDNTYVYWNEFDSSIQHCRVSQRLKDGGGSTTVRVIPAACWLETHPDLAQDDQFVYFPMTVQGVTPYGAYLADSMVRISKSAAAGYTDLFQIDCDADGEGPDGACGGFPGVLAVYAGSVYFDLYNFEYNGRRDVRRISTQGASSVGQVQALAVDLGFDRLTSITTDGTYAYWSRLWGSGGIIGSVPLVGGITSTVATLSGSPTSLVTPSTGAGGGSMFWLEVDRSTYQVDLKQRLPGGQIVTLAADLGILPAIEIYAARAVAVDDAYVYFFRRAGGDEQVARVPINGGAVTTLAQGGDVVSPMSMAEQGAYVYWTQIGAGGSGQGAVLRVGKPGAVTLRNISGQVRNAAGQGLSGAAMTGLPGNPSTDAGGLYASQVESGWSGTVIPVKTGYTFVPASRTYANVTSDQSDQNFTAAAAALTISGRVRDLDGAGIQGAAMTGLPGTPVTNADGTYTASVSYGWSGVVTPARTCYNFLPVSMTYTNLTSDQSNQDYQGYWNRYQIWGRVRTGDGSGIADVTFLGFPGGSPATNSDGFYSYVVPCGWSGTVRPVKACLAFTPETMTYNNITDHQANQNYTGGRIVYSISGYARTAQGRGITGVFLNGLPGPPRTDANGYYSASVDCGWSGTGTPVSSGYIFRPLKRSFVDVQGNLAGQDFTGLRPDMSWLVVILNSDSDNDGMPDDWEKLHGLNPYDPGDAGLDPDGDGLTNLREFQLRTDPRNADTDGDGMPDGWEAAHGLNPLVDDCHGDPDGDGFDNCEEYRWRTDPQDPLSRPGRGLPWQELLLGD